jgi:hypothetical protein
MAIIYLHIGTHKTGTTSIQYFLGTNRDKLKEQGIYQPVAGKPGGEPRSGNHQLPWEIRKKKKAMGSNCWPLLQEELLTNRHPKVVISAEDFSTMNENEIQQVRGLLKAHEVYIIIYLRNYKTFIKSVYYAVIKNDNDETRNFKQFILAKAKALNFNDLIEKWGNCFGIDHLMIRLYDRVIQTNGILSDFCIIIGLDPSSLGGLDLRYNVTPTEQTIKAIRLINIFKSWSPEWLFSNNKFRNYKIKYRNGETNSMLNFFRHFVSNRITTKKHEKLIREIVDKMPKDLLREYVGEEGIRILEQ